MTVEVTQAARELGSNNVSPHKLISLLMAGTLERVSQAKSCIEEGDNDDKDILLGKIIAIIKGLRESLNFDEGGEIAVNLDSLYVYMLEQMVEAQNTPAEKAVLNEVERLMKEVKQGWDQIDEVAAA